MKRLLILPLLFVLMLFTVQKAEAKIWTKELVDKVTLDSGYKFSLCTIDLKYDVSAAKNAGFLTVPDKDFEANPNSYPCNKNSQEDILFANITLYFSQANWGGGTSHEKVIQFQNKLYSVSSYGDIFNPDFVDSKKAYADLAGVDWFSTTPGLHAIRNGDLINTDPNAKGDFLPNSTFIVIHDPSTGKFVSALFVFNNVVYKLSSTISQVTTATTLVDYTQSGTSPQPSSQSTIQPSQSPISDETANWKTYTGPNGDFSFKYPSDLIVQEILPNYIQLIDNNQIIKVSIDARLQGRLADYNQTVSEMLNSMQSPTKVDLPNGVEIKGNIPPGEGSLSSGEKGVQVIIAILKYKQGALTVSSSPEINQATFNEILSTLNPVVNFQPSSTPEKFTQDFYDQYILCLNTPNSNATNCMYQMKEKLTGDLAVNFPTEINRGHFLCGAQSPPQKITVDKATVTDNKTVITVHTIYQYSGDVLLNVELMSMNGQWKIANFSCPSEIAK